MAKTLHIFYSPEVLMECLIDPDNFKIIAQVKKDPKPALFSYYEILITYNGIDIPLLIWLKFASGRIIAPINESYSGMSLYINPESLDLAWKVVFKMLRVLYFIKMKIFLLNVRGIKVIKTPFDEPRGGIFARLLLDKNKSFDSMREQKNQFWFLKTTKIGEIDRETSATVDITHYGVVCDKKTILKEIPRDFDFNGMFDLSHISCDSKAGGSCAMKFNAIIIVRLSNTKQLQLSGDRLASYLIKESMKARAG